MKLKRRDIFSHIRALTGVPGFLSIWFCIFALGFSAHAQSGRVKPAETPTPTPRPRRIYVPTEKTTSVIIPKTTPTPTPTPTPKKDDDDTLRIDSFLVPIPASVLNANGQAVTNLKIEDFELFIDGKKVEIGDIARSET